MLDDPNGTRVTSHDIDSNALASRPTSFDNEKKDTVEVNTNVIPSSDKESDSDVGSEEVIIVSGEDAARHLLPMRDDFDPSVTFRGMLLATALTGFQATMNQIYQFKSTTVAIQGTFLALIAYFIGMAWAQFLPRGDKFEARWRAGGGTGKPPLRIRILSFLNHGPFGLKEHAVCVITATAASNAAPSSQVFAAQDLFYNMPLSATTVVLSTLSIGLFGYGLAGLLRPVTVWHVDAVYWSSLPVVKSLQGLHWQEVKNSKPLRWFWYSYAGMCVYEWFPAYMFPWLNSVSVPCLAASKAKGEKAAVLTNLFGGSLNNEGLGWFNLSFDWQYITSFQTSLPLVYQVQQAAGLIICGFVMLGIYYGNVWGARSLPFMSTRLLLANGTSYPVSAIFPGGVLDEEILMETGIPRLTGTFAYAMLMANIAIGALVAHCVFFWGGDIVRTFKSAKKGIFNDPHHDHMHKHYREVPWWWYMSLLLVSFVLGLVVVLKENVTLPWWGYIVSLLLGSVISPFSCILYSRYGNGIATNNLSKLMAGLILPGLPVGNMYFAAWSHNTISSVVQLSTDLKLGEYLKVPARTMFLTQIYGTLVGAYINYAVMISIVRDNREVLTSTNGGASWSGATIQSYNTNATSWALAKYLYRAGKMYSLIPWGLLIGAGIVAAHRVIYQFKPTLFSGKIKLNDLNLPQLLQFIGYIPYNQSQTCVILSWAICGFFIQFYLRNYRPKIFKDYSYLVTGAFDGGSLSILFVLSFAVFGAGGKSLPFPSWWGNNVDGYYDWCPVGE